MLERIHRPAMEVGHRELETVGNARMATMADWRLAVEQGLPSTAPDRIEARAGWGWHRGCVPVDTVVQWDATDTVCQEREPSLGVPRLGCTGGDEARLYWSVPVGAPAKLCSPFAVGRLGAAGRYRLAQRVPV